MKKKPPPDLGFHGTRTEAAGSSPESLREVAGEVGEARAGRISPEPGWAAACGEVAAAGRRGRGGGAVRARRRGVGEVERRDAGKAAAAGGALRPGGEAGRRGHAGRQEEDRAARGGGDGPGGLAAGSPGHGGGWRRRDTWQAAVG